MAGFVIKLDTIYNKNIFNDTSRQQTPVSEPINIYSSCKQ